MKYNTPNNTVINDLITVAQTAADKRVRDKAIYELWDICGERLAGIMVGKSYKMDSDFSLNNCSPKERLDNLSYDAFTVFHNAVETFNPDLGVPFLAYTVQKSNWFLADAKRNNTKHSKREKCVDFSMECCSKIANTTENAYMIEAFKKTEHSDTIVNDCDWKDAAQLLYREIKDNAKLSKYIEIARTLCEEGEEYSDAEIARRMGCTRACIGQYRKMLVHTMEEKGLLGEFTQLMAA